ncbi:aspartate--tRNA ligase msd1 [Teratosphaeriaceae sp. CCFEE 6253]|nr:aspartate--tRNA ligase msd1 [Teratosphaeriaceae sp. CCFEE 6253]
MPETLAPWRCDLQSRRLPVVRLDAASFITELRRSTSSNLGAFKETLDLPPATCTFAQLVNDDGTWIDKQVVLHGYLGTRRVANRGLTFAELYDMNLEAVVQLVSTSTKDADAIRIPHHLLQDLAQYTPVVVHGTVKRRQAPKASGASKHNAPGSSSVTVITGSEIKLENISPLNSLPEDFIFRSKATRFIRDYLADKHGFEEIETPLLFKSTPEGAREFLVPTRSPGLAYALPQSPQQYKQILMASGIPRYMQIARCFRDEDLRADRQPEFTQVDLEMAFATGSDVMQVVEGMVKALWKQLLSIDDLPSPFPWLTYEQAMSRYGSDKPDTRLGAEISRIDYMLPVDLVSKIGPLTNPAVDVMRLRISDDADTTRQFVSTFMESPEAQSFMKNVDGQPGIFIIDSRKPLLGLQPFGFEAAERLEDMLELYDGDLVVLQARTDAPFAGGSTPIGALRLALHRSAVRQRLISAPTGFAFTWVNDFPLFSPITTADPGQGGSAGISSTHHPFTAPKTAEDVDLLLTDPLSVKADHYDLVVNGIELGGGSRRIHNAAMQEFVMRDVLKMSDARIKDFAHLIEVLRSGCPPHAGMALGLDRMIAVMLDKESVREVIAFPKSGRGEDLLVKSPTKMTEEQLKTYHLRLEEA